MGFTLLVYSRITMLNRPGRCSMRVRDKQVKHQVRGYYCPVLTSAANHCKVADSHSAGWGFDSLAAHYHPA